MKLQLLASVDLMLLCALGVSSQEASPGVAKAVENSVSDALNAVNDKLSALMGSDAVVESKSSRGYVRGDTSLVRSNADRVGSGSDLCGDDGVCVPAMPVRDHVALTECLDEGFPGGRESFITLFSNSDGAFQVKKITYPQDGKDFEKARNMSYGLRFPATIVYIANEDEVKSAIHCATTAGYKISPRGRGHHYQGLSAMDGYVVIDASLLCNPDDFILDRTEGDWLLPGQKKIGSILSGAGCTNAVMLAYTHFNFEPEEGGVYQIGTCPSVGITGYSTGGGAGDATPYVGWGVDDVLSVEMILYNGQKVTASKDENADLFWAVQGGGSGLGVITRLQTAVVQSPEPPEGSNRKFCIVTISYEMEDDAARMEFLSAFQEFLYENPESAKFGGGGGLFPRFGHNELRGTFLGGMEEFGDLFSRSGLFEHLRPGHESMYAKDYKYIPTPEGMPNHGVSVFEFSSYGEAVLYKICNTIVPNPAIGLMMTATSGDWCADLGLDDKNCRPVDGNVSYRAPSCMDPEAISAIAHAALDPASFFNRAGNFRRNGDPQGAVPTHPGGLLIPKVDVEVLNEIVKVGLNINHLHHGAPMTVKSGETSWAMRDTAILTEPISAEDYNQITAILVNQHYKDPTELQGYYNYMNPIGNPNWKKYYFGDNYASLSIIKSKYDPLNVFGNPMQVAPADTSTSSEHQQDSWAL